MEKENYTEQFRGIIMLRKGQADGEDVWFATTGNQLVSDGAFKTKEELIKNLEELNLEKVCKIISGAVVRAIELSTNNKEQ